MDKNQEKAISAMSFEAAMTELEGIVSDLEKGETELEGSIDAFERGITLKKHCEHKLRQAQIRVDKIETNADGAVGVEPYEAT